MDGYGVGDVTGIVNRRASASRPPAGTDRAGRRSSHRAAALGLVAVLIAAFLAAGATGAQARAASNPFATKFLAGSEVDLVQFSGVVRTAGGTPVSGVNVRASNAYGAGSVTTGSDGSFSMQVAAGQNSIVLRRESSETALHLPKFFYLEGSTSIEEDTEMNLALPASVALTAVVSDQHGNPVAGASLQGEPCCSAQGVTAYEMAPGVGPGTMTQEPSGPSTTDGEGDATIYTFPNANIGVRIGGPSGYTSVTRSVNATENDEFAVELEHHPLVQFSGVVRTAGGTPVSGVNVRASNAYGAGSVTTGSDGSFSMQVAAGQNSIVLRRESSETALHLPKFFYLEGSTSIEEDTEMNLALPASVALTAVVSDQHGNPVAGASLQGEPCCSAQGVTAYEMAPGVGPGTMTQEPSGPSTTDGEGDATIYTFPNANIGVRIGGPSGYTSVTRSVNATENDEFAVELEHHPLVQFSGVVRTAGGTPVSGVNVRASNAYGAGSVTTGSDGSFSMQVAAGQNSIVLRRESSETALHLPKFFYLEGSTSIEEDTEMNLALPASVALTAVVSDQHGNPVAGASLQGEPCCSAQGVTAYEMAPGVGPGTMTQEPSGPSTTDGEGDATIYTFPNANIGVRIGGPTGYVSATCSVAASASDEFDVTLAAGIPACAPAVTGVSPADGPQAGGSRVTVTGANLSNATSIAFGSSEASEATCTRTECSATAPAGTGTVDVKVTTPEGTSASTTSDHFIYVPPPPVVSAVAPRFGNAEGGDRVTITGEHLEEATAVAFGGESAGFEQVSAEEIVASAPAGTDTVAVSVTTAGGTSESTEADLFTYVANEGTPVIKKVSPKKGLAAGGSTVTITGANLEGVTGVLFGGRPGTQIVNVSKQEITVVSPEDSAETVAITLSTPFGTSAASKKAQFKYERPAITAISANAGPVAGGNTITISGYGFKPGSDVTSFAFKKTDSTQVECASTTSCTVLVPGATKSAAVQVSAAVGKAKSRKNPATDTYTYE